MFSSLPPLVATGIRKLQGGNCGGLWPRVLRIRVLIRTGFKIGRNFSGSPGHKIAAVCSWAGLVEEFPDPSPVIDVPCPSLAFVEMPFEVCWCVFVSGLRQALHCQGLELPNKPGPAGPHLAISRHWHPCGRKVARDSK